LSGLSSPPFSVKRPPLQGARTLLEPLAIRRTGSGFLLSWSCPLSPLHRFTCCVHSRSAGALLRASGSMRWLSFRPRGFAPPRRLAPRQGCGFVAPRCRSGVRRVSSDRGPPSLRAEARCTVEPSSAVPATRFGPFEGFPRQQPCRITAAFALLPLPRHRRDDAFAGHRCQWTTSTPLR
jgi:hypothetical protein